MLTAILEARATSRRFARAALRTAPDGWVSMALVYTVYLAWARRSGYDPQSARGFAAELAAAGYVRARLDGVGWVWRVRILRSVWRRGVAC